MDVNSNLKSIRKVKKMTQEEVALKLGIQTAGYSKIERGDLQLSVERLLELATIFEVDAADLLRSSEEVIEPVKNGNICYVPIHAQAGFLNGTEGINANDFLYFSIPIFSEKDLFMLGIEGDSMYPTIVHGTFVIVRELVNLSMIKWGEPYIVVTSEGVVAKRVLKPSDDYENRISLYSDNELYQPYEVERTDVLSLWEIKGQLSRSFVKKNVELS